MKIKIKDLFSFIVDCIPDKMSSAEAAEKIVIIAKNIPYTDRTVKDYIQQTRAGSPPSVSVTKREVEIEIDLDTMVEKGFIVDEHIFDKTEDDDITAEEIKNTPINVVDFEITGGNAWSIEGQEYIWKSTSGNLSISKILLNDLFYYYSKHGMNWTRSKICRKFNIAPKVFRSIIRAFELSKDSNIYAPHVVDELTPQELDDFIDKKMTKVFTSGERVEEKYTKSLNDSMAKIVDQNLLQQMEIDEFLGEIAENVKLIPSKIMLITSDDAQEDEIVVALADLHIGAEVTGIKRVRDFSTDILKKYLKEVEVSINSQKSKAVHLVIAGDILEGTPTNHPNSFKGIQRGLYWGYQLIEASQILTKFFEGIINLKSIQIVGGNHDRATGDNKADTEGTYAAALAYFIKEVYKKEDIEVQYHYDILGFDALGARFIVAHGDKGFHKKPVSDIIFEHGDSTKYNVILMGHWHSLQIPKDGDHARYIKFHLPSLYTGNEYSASAGYSSLPGFTVFTKGEINDKTVDFKIKRL